MHSPTSGRGSSSTTAQATTCQAYTRRGGFAADALPNLLSKIYPVLPCKASEEELSAHSNASGLQFLELESKNSQDRDLECGTYQAASAPYPDLPSSIPRPLTSQTDAEPASPRLVEATPANTADRPKVRFASEVSILRLRPDRVRRFEMTAKKVAAKWKGTMNNEEKETGRRGRSQATKVGNNAAAVGTPPTQMPRQQRRLGLPLQLPSLIGKRISNARPSDPEEKEGPLLIGPSPRRKTLISLNCPDDTPTPQCSLALDPLRLLTAKTQGVDCDMSDTTSECTRLTHTPSPRPQDEGASSSTFEPSEENRQQIPKLLLQVRQENQEVVKTLERLRGGRQVFHRSSDQKEASHSHCADKTTFRRRFSHLLGLEDASAALSTCCSATATRGRPSTGSSKRSSISGAADGTSKAVPTIRERRRSFICTLRSSLEDRLQRIGKLTKMHWTVKNQSFRGLSGRDFERFAVVFQQYDQKRTGTLGIEEVLLALDDLGLRLGCSWQQHASLCVKVQAAKDGRLDFGHFCQTALVRRTQIQETQRANLRSLFEQYGKNGSGELGPEELFDCFTQLGMQPERDDERIAFLHAILECDADCSGTISWDEFELLAQTMREKLAECRCERESRICSQAHILAEKSLNFRNELMPIHDAFQCFDKFGQSLIERQALPRLILQLGFGSNLKVINVHLQDDPALNSILGFDDNVSFAVVLNVLKHLRDCRLDANFRRCLLQHEMSNGGVLKARDVIDLLNSLGLKLRSEQRTKILQVVEETDMDGDGILTRPEFTVLFHKVTEMMQQQQRQEEQAAAERLGFSADELWDLRESFALLEVEGTGRLSMEGVTKALQLLGESWAKEYQDYYQCLEPQGCQGVLGFEAFLTICRLVNTLDDHAVQNRKEVIWGKVRQLSSFSTQQKA